MSVNDLWFGNCSASFMWPYMHAFLYFRLANYLLSSQYTGFAWNEVLLLTNNFYRSPVASIYCIRNVRSVGLLVSMYNHLLGLPLHIGFGAWLLHSFSKSEIDTKTAVFLKYRWQLKEVVIHVETIPYITVNWTGAISRWRCRYVSAGCGSLSTFISESAVAGRLWNRLGRNSLFKSDTTTCQYHSITVSIASKDLGLSVLESKAVYFCVFLFAARMQEDTCRLDRVYWLTSACTVVHYVVISAQC